MSSPPEGVPPPAEEMPEDQAAPQPTDDTPSPAAAAEQALRRDEEREPPLLKKLSVSVFGSEDGYAGGSPDYQEIEDIDVNAPVHEVLAQLEDVGLGDEDIHAEDIAYVYLSKPGGDGRYQREPIRVEDFADTSLAEAGWEETTTIGLMTRQYVRRQDERYGARRRRGDGPSFGDIAEHDFVAGEPGRDTPGEFKEPTSVSGKHRVLSTIVHDFRRCTTLPKGVIVVDPQADSGAGPTVPDLEEQNDKSMALVLKAGQWVELDLDPDAPDPGVPRQKQAATRNYTVTMDVKLEELPASYLALFSPCSKNDAAELCQLDRYGGVGAYSQFGVKDAAVKPGKWSRIVVTVRLGQEQGMTTYVTGPKGTVKCAEVRSNYFVAKDSALVLSKGKMRLFFSPEASHAIGDKKIRLKYISVKRRYMDLDMVKEHVEKDRIFDYWSKDKDDEEALGSLFLHGVKGARMGQPPRTVPIFVTPPFLAEFASDMLRGSGWTGGNISLALPVVSKVLESILEPLEGAPSPFGELFKEFAFSTTELQALNAVSKVLRDGCKLAQKSKLVSRGGPQLVQFLKLMKKQATELCVGGSMIVPGKSFYPNPRIKSDIIGVSIMYILERTSSDTFRFVVVNTDVEGGLGYHQACATDSAPAIDFKLCMVMDDVPIERMLDDAWWLFVLKLASDGESPSQLYDLLLPWLTDTPLEENFAAASEVDFRPPHDNDVSFYRCVTESVFYLLRRQSFSAERAEQIMFAMRSMMLMQADRDLSHAQMSQREARFLKIAWQQYANSTVDLEQSKLLSVGQLLQSRKAIEELKKHVDTRLTWLSWSEQAELNEMHVFANSKSRTVAKPTRVLFIASIADGGHEGIADSLMKESHELEKAVSSSDGGLQPALPMGLFSAISKYSDVQAKLKLCAETADQGPLALHFSSHGSDDDQSIRFQGNNDIKQFAQDIADAKPAVVILSACLTLPLGLAIWEASPVDAKPTVVCWAKPVGTVVAEVFTKTFYNLVAQAASAGKVVRKKDYSDIDAADPLALRQILHIVGEDEKLKQEIKVVNEPEAEATRVAPKSSRSDGPPAALNLNAADSLPQGCSSIPLCETLPRKDDVDGLVGTAADASKYTPVDFLRVPQLVSNVAQAVDAMRVCDELCSLMQSQSKTVKNSAHLRACLIEHVFVHVVPIPLPQRVGSHKEEGGVTLDQDCIWAQDMTYSQQLDVMILLQRLMEHFASSCFSLHNTRSFDAVRIVVAAAIAAVADSVMRRRASDIPSVISTHLLGETVHGTVEHAQYGIDTSSFAEQSETCEVHTPELNVARSSVLDYFSAQTKTVKIFSFEKGNKPQKSTTAFLQAIAKERVYAASASEAHRQLDNNGFSIDRNFGSSCFALHKNCPEFGPWRDVCFYMKYFLNPDEDAFPKPQLYAYRSNEAALHWDWDAQNGEFIVGAKYNCSWPCSAQKLFQLSCIAQPKKPKHAQSTASKKDCKPAPLLRYPSGADVTLLVDDFVNQGEDQPVSINVKTEDDILHLRNLPTFDDSLTASDSELLLSYLTEPYLRIPLVLSFFATEDRIHALKQPQLRYLLDAVLWEPGKYSSAELSSQVPQEVPTPRRELLATTHGLMLNELCCSPTVVLQSTVRLLKLALDLNTGTVHGSTTEIILFVCRLASRIDSYVSFAIHMRDGTHQSIRRKLRDFDIPEKTLTELKLGLAQMRSLLHGDLLSMIKTFSISAYREYKDSTNEETLSVNTRIMCCLHSHLILACRNLPFSALDTSSVKNIMASFVPSPTNKAVDYSFFVHLNCRHSFNTGRQVDLPTTEYVIPETLLYETLQVQRRHLVQWCQPVEATNAERRSVLQSKLDAALAQLELLFTRQPSTEDKISLCNTIASINAQMQALPNLHQSADVSGTANPAQLNEVMTDIQAITSDTGSFAGPDIAASAEVAEDWGFISGRANHGRYTVTSHGGVSDEILSIEADAGLGAEIDFQLATLTLKGAHVEALNEDTANMPDVKAVFGNEAMQCTTLQSAEHRVWYRLMGRGHDIQFWQTDDARKFKEIPECFGEYEREYFEDLHKETELWMAQIFEPVRKTYFEPPGQPPIRFLMRNEPAKETAHVITMLAVHPAKKGAWKQVVISKAHKTVQCYEIISHGRRWHKSLQYCNDRRFALRCMLPDMTQVRRQAWPEWERHGGGHPFLVHARDDLTAVITRSWGTIGRHSRNLSGGVETYIPDRLLFGILPEALLDPKLPEGSTARVKSIDRYEFWQGEDDRIRGYPVHQDQQHMIEIDLHNEENTSCTKVAGVGCTVRRVSRQQVESDYAEIIKVCELVISSRLLVPTALGGKGTASKNVVSEKSPKPKQKVKVATVAESDEAPVSFELFRFIQSFAEQPCWPASLSACCKLGCRRTRQLVERLVEQRDSTATGFQTRSQLRKALESMKESVLDATPSATDSSGGSSSDEQMELIDLLYAEPGSNCYSIAQVLARLDTIAHVLCWSRNGESIDVIEIPRLSLTFVARKDDNGQVRLESSDHAGLFIQDAIFGLDRQTSEMLRGMPHSLVLTDSNGQHTILCAALPLLRPVIPEDPFSTELVLDRHKIDNDRRRSWVNGYKWAKHVDKYFLYPVHVSKTFLLHRSLASALYLLVLRLLNRNYRAAFALANAISTDNEYSSAERCIFAYLQEAVYDQHPDAVACRLRIAHAVSAVPKVQQRIPWDCTLCMSSFVLSLRSISASTRMPHKDLLQLLKLCCTSTESDEFSAKKGHTEYKIAVVANYKSLLSSYDDDDDAKIQLQIPARVCGSGWPYLNNKLVYSLDKHAPTGSNMGRLQNPAQLSSLLAKTTGELLVLFIHEQPQGEISQSIHQKMISMSSDRHYRNVIFRFVSKASLEQDATADMVQKLAVKTTPSIIFYKLDEDDELLIDESLVGTRILARKQPNGYANFASGKKYDAEVVGVNADGTLHLRYDDESLEDTNAPASLTDFGRDASDKTDQLVVQLDQEVDTVITMLEATIERLMDTPEDETWRENLIVGDEVDAAIEVSAACKHCSATIVPRRSRGQSCTVCKKRYRELRSEGMDGTDYQCSDGCSYYVCRKCERVLRGTNLQWYRGIVVGCSDDNVSVHFELLPNDKNITIPWNSLLLKERGSAEGYYYSSLKPNPEDEEEDERVIALRGYKNSGMAEDQFLERHPKWSYRPAKGSAIDHNDQSEPEPEPEPVPKDQADGTHEMLDAEAAIKCERAFQRGIRLGLAKNDVSYTVNGKPFTCDVASMTETNVESGITRRVVRSEVGKADEDPSELLLEQYAQLVDSGSLGVGKEACTIVVSGLDIGAKSSSVEEFKEALRKMKQRSDTLLPDDGWNSSEIQTWCSKNCFAPPDGIDAMALVDAIQQYVSNDEISGPMAGFENLAEWRQEDGQALYFIEYATPSAAKKARTFVKDQPAGISSSQLEFVFAPNDDDTMMTGFNSGQSVVVAFEAADVTSKKFRKLIRKGQRFVAKNVVSSKSGLFIEVETDQRNSGGFGLPYDPMTARSDQQPDGSVFFLLESREGSWTRYSASNNVASAEFVSALRMKSGTTWMKMSKHWKDMTLHHVEVRKQTGYAVVESMDRMWPQKETCTGEECKQGFLYLYSLFTGKTQLRVLDQDNGHTMATLYTRMLLDSDEFALLPSILSQLSRNPALCAKLQSSAIYSDRRKKREVKVSSEPVGSEASPLAQLFVDMVPQIIEFEPNAKPDVAARAIIDPPVSSCPVPVTRPRSWVVSSLSDYSNASRVLNIVTAENLQADDNLRAAFRDRPLSSIGVTEIIAKLSREEMGAKALAGKLPFDVNKHEQCRATIAQAMLKRMEEDVKEYADSVNGMVVQSLAALTPSTNRLIASAVEPTDGDSDARLNLISIAEKDLLQLSNKLRLLRSNDQRYIDRATPAVLEMAGQVFLPEKDDEDFSSIDTLERYRYDLKRVALQEPEMTFEFIVGALLSSKAVGDLQQVNPFLSASSVDKIFDLVVIAILSANRISQINRCLNDIQVLGVLLKQSGKLQRGVTDLSLLAALNQKSQSLATHVMARRHYINEGDYSYDPRYLVFEYVGENQIMLRRAQVEMVRKFVVSTAVVKQMIMGAGKTTVIAPLLALMLGDGKSLVLSVVPKALLDMSRNVMRSTFSSIIEKRVYTLSFDRGSDVPPSLLDKLETARLASGIVIATPTTLKSIQLKFLELLSICSDVNRPRVPEMVEHVDILAKVLQVFKHGILLMDEVDVILHPLKSELNFPFGEKHDLDANPLRWELPVHIIDCIFFAERRKTSADLGESAKARVVLDEIQTAINEGIEMRALQESPHIILLNPLWYHERLKPAVADWCLLWLEKQHVGKSGLSDSTIRKYILGGANPGNAQNDEHRAELQILHDAVSDAAVSDMQRKMLNLAHDWLQHFFPHCLSKIDRVTFGVLNETDYNRIAKVDPDMPDTRRYLAIPFEGKDVPSKSSEFAHPDVLIGLTILGYRYEGLRYTDFDQIMNSLRATLAKEVGPYSQRKSSLLHQSWVAQAGGIVQKRALTDDTDDLPVPGIWERYREPGGPEWEDLPQEDREEWMDAALVVPLRLLKRSNSGQMAKLFDLLQFEPCVIIWYLMEIIFPTHMRHQHLKLSASGQDLGGEILFPKRIGFSGTPSDLLPKELGQCDYERGSDGKMVSVMTDKDVCSAVHLQNGWTAETILERIATAETPRKALIDTGALITGLSNYEVAQFMVDAPHKLPWCDGVVYLDEDDKKMILVRATGRVQELATCGIKPANRFVFYDQVHTTGASACVDLARLSQVEPLLRSSVMVTSGMDIQHSLDATAVLTLGKDMVFRDYVQGAFRMRQIGVGQTVEVYVIPEVAQLIERELSSTDMVRTDDNTLEQISGWLVISSMRSERVQSNQLILQNLNNSWRKTAFTEIQANCSNFQDVCKHQAIASFTAGLADQLDSSKRSSVEECIATVLFIDHLPIVVPQKLKTLKSNVCSRVFKRFQSKIESVFIPTDAAGKSQGMAFVTFNSEDDLKNALNAEGETKSGEAMQPDGFPFDKKHTLKVCRLADETAVSEDQLLVPKSVADSLRLFEETIDFSLAGCVPDPVPFEVSLQQALDSHTRWLGDEAVAEMQRMIDSVKGLRLSNHQASLEAEQTQEQEEEREKELEDEKEKEIEIEKFSDAAYSRENEAPVPWEFASLADAAQCVQFYPADQFKLFKRKGLKLPQYVQLSQNYFSTRWSGERRLKNVVVLMEWIPSLAQRTLVPKDEMLTASQEEAVERAIELFGQSSDRLDASAVLAVISAACDLDIDSDELRQVVAQFKKEEDATDQELGRQPSALVATTSNALVRTRTAEQETAMQLLRGISRQLSRGTSRSLDRDGIRRLLLSAKFREEFSGHFTVAISLAEASTIRRIMHLKARQPDLIEGNSDTALALRVLPAGNVALDTSQQFRANFTEVDDDSTAYSVYQQEASCQVMRFLNSDMHFSESQLNMLLRLLHSNTERERRRFFVLMIGCRRRLQQKYENTPVMKLFSIADEWALLKQRAQASFVRSRLAQMGKQMGDAFHFIRGSSSIIKAPEMLGAFVWLGDSSMTPREVVDFIRANDKDGDGGLNYEEFLAMINTNVDANEEDDDEIVEEDAFEVSVDDTEPMLMRSETGTVYDHVVPMRQSSIARLESQDATDRAAALQAEEISEREEYEAMMRETELEQERENQSQPGGPNPRIEYQSDGERTTAAKLTWWFTRVRDPKGLKWGGSGNVSRSAVRTAYPEGNPPLKGGEVTRVMSSSFLRVPLEIKQDARDLGSRLDKFSLSLHVRLESLPKVKETTALFATTQEDVEGSSVKAFVFIDAKGNVRFGDGTALFGTVDGVTKIKPMHWYVISVSVDASLQCGSIWINGKPHCIVEQGAHQLKRQGMHSLSETLCVFGSSDKKQMQGVKLLTMMTLQMNCLDDERAKAVYNGAEGGFVGEKGGKKAGGVELARLHSAVGYAEGEARIAQLVAAFATIRKFSRAEVVHALTTVYKPKGKVADESATVGVILTAENASESMLGSRAETADGKGKGRLVGYKVAGNRTGDTSGGLASDGFCRVDFDSGHPGGHGKGGWNIPMSSVRVFSKPPALDPAAFHASKTEEGQPIRDFEAGGFAMLDPDADGKHKSVRFGTAGYHCCMFCGMHGPSPQSGENYCRKCHRCDVCCSKAPECTYGSLKLGPEETREAEQQIFEILRIGIPPASFDAMASMLPQIQDELAPEDRSKQGAGRTGWKNRQTHTQATVELREAVTVTASDFLVVQPLPKLESGGDTDAKSKTAGGAPVGTKVDQDLEFEQEDNECDDDSGSGGDEERHDDDSQSTIRFDPSSFSTDLQQLLHDEHLVGLKALARFGIYHTSSLVVAASNLVQEVGDIAVAMKALRARVDQPSAQTTASVSDDEDDPETDFSPRGGARASPSDRVALAARTSW